MKWAKGLRENNMEIYRMLSAKRIVSVVAGLLLCLAVSTSWAEASGAPLKWWQKTLMYTGVFFIVGFVFFLALLIIKSKM